MLNKLRCHAHSLFSANQITCCYDFTYLNGKQCRSRSVGFWRSQLIWIYTCLQRKGISGFSRTRVILRWWKGDNEKHNAIKRCRVISWIHKLNFASSRIQTQDLMIWSWEHSSLWPLDASIWYQYYHIYPECTDKTLILCHTCPKSWTSSFYYSEPSYNDSICSQRCCH